MKTLLTLLILSKATLITFAQTDTSTTISINSDSINRFISKLEKSGVGHLKFKDIPMDGPLSQFVAKLKKQGFTLLKTTNVDAFLKGKFTGDDVNILVQGTSKLVYGVTVNYNKQTSWKAIKTLYDNIKSMLTSKYGSPRETIEIIDDPYYQEAGLQLLALSEDKCTYMSLFASKTGNGMIKLRIASDASLLINYVDSINFLRVSGKAYDDL